MMYDKNRIEMLRERYPKGTRIELVSMDDPYSKLKPGDQGEVFYVDDMATVHINWDCGSTLGLVYGEDSFKVVKEHEQEESGPQMNM